jgi:probable phosphoglycerate mutase
MSIHPIPFIFVRHGESTWNAERRVQGQTDVPLSEKGLAQARDAATLVAGKPVGAVFASPLQRARHTAEIINEVLGLPITLIDDLMEARLGVLEGKVYESGLGDWDRGIAPEGAETQEGFFARAISGINQALTAWEDQKNRQEARRDAFPLIVAHGGVFRAVQHHALGNADWLVLNCCPVLVLPPERHGSAWTMEEL